MNNNLYDCIIIGSGPAGYTAGIYTKRSGLDVLMLTGNVVGGQLTTTSEIENFPGFINGIGGLDLMNNMKEQSERFGLKIKYENVTNIEIYESLKYKIYTNDSIYHTRSIIISTGSSSKYLGLDSEKYYLSNGGGVSTCATCDGFFYRDKDVVVVGAGDTACEEALYLSKICNSVTMIVRGDKFRSSKFMYDMVNKSNNIKILYNSEIKDIIGNDNIVNGVILKNNTMIKCDGVFICIGHKPNTNVFKNIIELDNDGYIITKNDVYTNIKGIFAAGDVQDKKYRQAITAAGSGCMAAISVDRYLNEMK